MNFIKRVNNFLVRKWIENSKNVKSDELYLRVLYFLRMHKLLNLSNPKTLNEKIQWLKLYAYKPEYSLMVDKYLVKDYVGDIIGHQYITPALGCWDNVDDIDFDLLPNQFVLKTNHDCGGIVICKDKINLDIDKAKSFLKKHLDYDYFLPGRDKPYKYVERKVFAEKYLEDSQTSELRDYKFFCFDGIVKCMFIVSGRQKCGECYCDFFDENFVHLDFRRNYPNAPMTPSKPICFEEMKSLSEILSKGIPFVRVDFYEVDGKAFFGEMTFYTGGGATRFHPSKWDYIFGNMVTLPPKYWRK